MSQVFLGPVRVWAGYSPEGNKSPVDGAAKMSRGLHTRRGLQALALVIATAYATILLYQAVAPRQVYFMHSIASQLYRHSSPMNFLNK